MPKWRETAPGGNEANNTNGDVGHEVAVVAPPTTSREVGEESTGGNSAKKPDVSGDFRKVVAREI